jgi:hypothetical protein
MLVENLYEELVDECKCKLRRDLTSKEVELIKWIQERQYEMCFQRIKSS